MVNHDIEISHQTSSNLWILVALNQQSHRRCRLLTVALNQWPVWLPVRSVWGHDEQMVC